MHPARRPSQVLINIHPDKVQQRGGSVSQRYVADKARAAPQPLALAAHRLLQWTLQG